MRRMRVIVSAAVLLALAGCAASKRTVNQPASLSDFEVAVAPRSLSCTDAEIFGNGSAFSCDRSECLRLAHDRAEEDCPTMCAGYYACTPPLECSGMAIECKEPLVVQFKAEHCAERIGFNCVGACRCECGCAREM